MTTTPADRSTPHRSRRRLLGGGLAAMATGTGLLASRADAAPATAAWTAGGNTAITTDGTNYLGTRNVAPLIIKTAATANTPVERLRVTPTGQVGVGTNAPGAQLHVRGNGIAVRAQVTGAADTAVGVQGLTSNGSAVEGKASGSGTGVVGSGVYGVVGRGSGTSVYGDGGNFGVYGSGSLYGVYGFGDYGVTGSGSTYGVVGSASGYGLFGSGDVGVYGSGRIAVRGEGGGTGSYGVYATGDRGGVFTGNTSGVYTSATTRAYEGQAIGDGTEGVAVFGDTRGSTASANKYAGYFVGNVAVFGTLSKSAGSFKIDHPVDPERKWLSHSFVESPDMMNVYNGNVVLDARGEATVALPDYFGALNRDYRYQLTCVGAHAPVYVSKKVHDNRFSIAGGSPGLEVSWQVTGIRQDSYAKAHPIVVEEDKTGDAAGALAFAPAGSGARSAILEAGTPPDAAMPRKPTFPAEAPHRSW